jgi:hypothetical protein
LMLSALGSSDNYMSAALVVPDASVLGLPSTSDLGSPQ